jgi:hypothetical protein
MVGMFLVVISTRFRYELLGNLLQDGVQDALDTLCVFSVTVPDCDEDGREADAVACAAYVVYESCWVSSGTCRYYDEGRGKHENVLVLSLATASCRFSPMARRQTCFQKSGACSFGTLNVQAPPRAFLGSSHNGLTPFLNKCTESLRCMALKSKLLYSSQKCLTSVRSSNLTSRSSYFGISGPSGVVDVVILGTEESGSGDFLRSCRSCQNTQPCTRGYVGRRRRWRAATIARPRAGESVADASGSDIEGRFDVWRGVREAIMALVELVELVRVCWMGRGSMRVRRVSKARGYI